jgi:hypothetical protein
LVLGNTAVSQTKPGPQVSFGQHGWSAPPQAAQVPLVEMPVVSQTFPGKQVAEESKLELPQHGSPSSPQATHVDEPPLVRQVVSGAVQRLPEQQGSPRPPQFPQAPSSQVPPTLEPQLLPDALQVAELPLLETQQPPSRQKLPGQQGSPDPPQASHLVG